MVHTHTVCYMQTHGRARNNCLNTTICTAAAAVLHCILPACIAHINCYLPLALLVIIFISHYLPLISHKNSEPCFILFPPISSIRTFMQYSTYILNCRSFRVRVWLCLWIGVCVSVSVSMWINEFASLYQLTVVDGRCRVTAMEMAF